MTARRPSEHTVEDAHDLLRAGEAPEHVCTRLGLTASAVAMAAYRVGDRDLGNTFNRLRTRQPRPSQSRRYRQNRTAA